MASDSQSESDKVPTYILVAQAVLARVFTFFVGIQFIKIWFYKGDLGPGCQTHIILPGGSNDVNRNTSRDGESERKREGDADRMTTFSLDGLGQANPPPQYVEPQHV